MGQDFQAALERLKAALPGVLGAFEGLRAAAAGDGVLPAKQKALVMVGIAAAIRCEQCLQVHVKTALELGATRDEILEAVGCAILMGGGPVVGFCADKLLEAIEKAAAV